MKMTIGRITRTAMLAVAFMLCATGQAWAENESALIVNVAGTSVTIANYSSSSLLDQSTANVSNPKICISSGLNSALVASGMRVRVDNFEFVRDYNGTTAAPSKIRIVVDGVAHTSDTRTETSLSLKHQGNASYPIRYGCKYVFPSTPYLKVGESYDVKFLDSNGDTQSSIRYEVVNNSAELITGISAGGWRPAYTMSGTIITTVSKATNDTITSADAGGLIVVNGGTVNVSGSATATGLIVSSNTTLHFEEGATLTLSGPLYVESGNTLAISSADTISGSRTFITAGDVCATTGAIVSSNAAYSLVYTSTSVSLTSYANTASVSGEVNWSSIGWVDGTWHDGYPTTLTLTGDATINFDNTYSMPSLTLTGAHTATLVYSKTPTISGAISCENSGTYKIKIPATSTDWPIGSAWTVPNDGVTYILAGSADSSSTNTCSGKITVNGKLETTGYLDLSAANKIANTGELTVLDGSTKMNTGSNENGICGTLNIESGATFVNALASDALHYNGSATVNVSGTLNMGSTRWTIGGSNTITLHEGAVVTCANNNGNGALNWNIKNSTPNMIVDGNATLSARIKIISSATLTIDVASGKTLTIETGGFLDNGLGPVKKTGLGVISNTATRFNVNTLTVSQGKFISTEFPSGTVSIADGATFTLKNKAWTDQPSRFSGSGTLELLNDRDGGSWAQYHCTHSVTGVTFPGTLKFTTTSTATYGCGHVISNAGFLSSEVRPQLELNTLTGNFSKLFFSTAFDGQTLKVRDLKGTGDLSAKASGTTAQNQTLENMQTKDTEFAGNLLSDSDSDIHKTNLKVIGDGTGVAKTLTISGANTSNGELSIADSKVVFTSTGKWSVGTVTVKDGGILESKNSDAIAANLKVEKGATLKFADGIAFSASNCDWTDLDGELTDEEKVKLDLSAVTPSSTPVTLISSGVSSADIFTVSATKYGASVALSVVNGALKATYSGNICENGVWLVGPTANQDASILLSESSTLTTTSDLTLGTVTVYNISGASAVLSTSGAGELTLGGLNFPYTGITLEVGGSMTVSGSVLGAATISVLDGGELNMDGVTCAPDIIVQSGGTLNASGTTSFSRTLTNAGVFNIESGTTTVAGAFNTQSGSTMSVAGTLSISDSGTDPSFAGDVNVSGTMYVIGLYRYAVIDGEINVTGMFSSQGEATVGATGRVIVSGSGVFAVNYGTANSGIIQLPSVSSYQIAAGGTKAITNSDSGIVILANSGSINNDSEDYSFLKGTGTLVFVNADNNGYWVWPNAESKQFDSRLSISNEVVNGICVCYGTNDANNPAITAFRNLSGSGKFRSDWNSSYPNRKLQITQTRNTKWSGQFIAGNRIDGIEVFGVGTTKTLELAGTACTEANRKPPLTIDSTGSVNLSNEWRGNTIVNGEFGGVGSVIGTLNINNDATFKAFASDANGLSVSSTTTFANGDSDNVNIDVSAIVSDITSSGVTLISSTGALTVDVDKLTVTSGYFCQKENNLLKVYPIVASVGGTPYATLQAAIDAAGANTVTLLQNNSESITIAAGRTLNVEKGAFTCNVPTSTGCIAVQTDYNDGTGITTYTAPVAAITSTSSTSYYMSVGEAELMTFIALVNADPTTTMIVDETVALDQATRTFLSNQYDIYFNGTTVYSKAVAKRTYPTVATFNSLASAISDSADGALITLVQDSNEAITLNKTITLTETATFTGSFTGTGTLVLGAALKSASSDRWAAGWTGTVELKDITSVITDFDFADYGNANSTVKANNVLVRMPETGGEYGNVGTIEIAAGDLKFGGNPIAGQDFTFSAAITGTGKIRVGTRCNTASPAHSNYIFKGDLSGFSGGVDFNDAGDYKATIVFQSGSDVIPALNSEQWGEIIVTQNRTISVAGELYGPGGIIIKGTVNVLTGGSVRVNTNGGDKVQGDGTLSYASMTSLPASVPTLNSTYWRGTVVLPSFNASSAGVNFNDYGVSGSTVELSGDGMTAGWIKNGGQTVAPKLKLTGPIVINGLGDGWVYTFAEISGPGNLSFSSVNQPGSVTITKISEDYSGTITSSLTPTITITTLAKTDPVSWGTKLLGVGGTGGFSVTGVTVGGTPTPIRWRRKTVGGVDGLYVVYGTIFSVW